jgi:2-methylcitrate dehydratase PrpD
LQADSIDTHAARSGAVTRTLARFVAQTQWSDLPVIVRNEAKRALVNYFAVALAGSHDPTLGKAVAVYGRFSANDHVSIVGRSERVDMLNAAALNAMSANVYDFDDTHIPTIIHPTAPVAAALFALAEVQPMNGEALLLAFVLGVEAECRIGNAVSPEHYQRGWHITSTCGVLGAAAAVAKALRLSENEIVWALGNASVQAGGLVETLGTMSKSISVGNAARNGLLSALLARRRFLGPRRAARRRARISARCGLASRHTRDHANTWARVATAEEHVQAVSVWRRAQPGDRRVPRSAPRRALVARRYRAGRAHRAPFAARAHGPARRAHRA